jgi:hypothetical protein
VCAGQYERWHVQEALQPSDSRGEGPRSGGTFGVMGTSPDRTGGCRGRDVSWLWVLWDLGPSVPPSLGQSFPQDVGTKGSF